MTAVTEPSEAAIDQAAHLVAAMVNGPGSDVPTRVIAVDGRSGAGKSTLANALARLLGEPGAPVPVIRLDTLYPGWGGLEAGVDRLVSGVLEPMARGRAGRLQRYDWVRGRDGRTDPVPPAPLLVVEGCGAGARRCQPSLLVWLEAPEPIRYRRAIARDGDTFRPHWRRWADQEASHLCRERTSSRADVIVETVTWQARSASHQHPPARR
jgi:energy-coupling factor transporter ATP-binding protein EcfA2